MCGIHLVSGGAKQVEHSRAITFADLVVNHEVFTFLCHLCMYGLIYSSNGLRI